MYVDYYKLRYRFQLVLYSVNAVFGDETHTLVYTLNEDVIYLKLSAETQVPLVDYSMLCQCNCAAFQYNNLFGKFNAFS